MPRKRYSTEQIVAKLRQAEVELGRGLRTFLACWPPFDPLRTDPRFQALLRRMNFPTGA